MEVLGALHDLSRLRNLERITVGVTRLIICAMLSMRKPRIQSKGWSNFLLIYKELRNCDRDAGLIQL